MFACATHVFLDTPDAARAHGALRIALDPAQFEHLNVFLAFVRTAHYWTKLHPELGFEDDVVDLLSTHEVLAACVLNDPEAQPDSMSRKIAGELLSLVELRNQNATITTAYEALNVDHEYVKHSLQERETNLRELVSVMPAAVYACDENGSIVYYNSQAAAMWGREPELNGHAWSFLDSRKIFRNDGTRVHPELTPVRRVVATGQPVINHELLLERPDGSRIYILANIAPLHDAAGRICGAVNIFQNITEIKQREQERERMLHELERSNRDLSEFSYAVSHDLQAPVRSVRALTQLLVRREGGPPEDVTHLAALIQQAAEDMQRLIETLLQYAQAGQGELNRQTVSVADVVQSVRIALGASIAKTRARIICRRLPEINADPVQLKQVFQNLLANAINYHNPAQPPVIEIDGEPVENGWRFKVTDNGQGIPAEFHTAVFEPLKRLHGNETPGTGIGLALCRAIVVRHGGRIWVESEGAGSGATFFFTLSKTSNQPQAVSHLDTQALPLKAGFAVP